MLKAVLFLLLLAMTILIGIALVAVTSTGGTVWGWVWQAWLIAAALAWALRWLIADAAGLEATYRRNPRSAAAPAPPA